MTGTTRVSTDFSVPCEEVVFVGDEGQAEGTGGVAETESRRRYGTGLVDVGSKACSSSRIAGAGSLACSSSRITDVGSLACRSSGITGAGSLACTSSGIPLVCLKESSSGRRSLRSSGPVVACGNPVTRPLALCPSVLLKSFPSVDAQWPKSGH